MFNQMKKSWNAFIKRLTAENQKQFGGKQADCCKLNKPQEEPQK